jgi:hypothetical protein
MKTSGNVVVANSCAAWKDLTGWLCGDWWSHAHSFLEKSSHILAGRDRVTTLNFAIAGKIGKDFLSELGLDFRMPGEVEEGGRQNNGGGVRTSNSQQLALRIQLVEIVATLAGFGVDSLEEPVKEVFSDLALRLGVLLQFLFVLGSLFETFSDEVLPLYDYGW